MIAAARPVTLPYVAAPSVKTDLRPNVEWWEANGQRFDSTADLVKSLPLPATGVEATYHFRDKATYTAEDARTDTINGAVAGAGVGGLVVGGGAVALNVMSGILTILTAGFLGGPTFVGIALPALVGAAAGAVIGAFSGRSGGKEAFEQGTSISGQLASGATGPTFYVGGQLSNAVDLSSYATAQPIPAASPVPAVPAWKDALKGAGIGAATPLATWIPIVGLAAPAFVGYAAGKALHPSGGALGAAVGVGATAGLIAAANGMVGLAVFPVASAVGAVAGAALGPVVLPRIRQEEADDAVTRGQWWRTYSESADQA